MEDTAIYPHEWVRKKRGEILAVLFGFSLMWVIVIIVTAFLTSPATPDPSITFTTSVTTYQTSCFNPMPFIILAAVIAGAIYIWRTKDD